MGNDAPPAVPNSDTDPFFLHGAAVSFGEHSRGWRPSRGSISRKTLSTKLPNRSHVLRKRIGADLKVL
jgi:hypothetical protein